MVGHQAASGQVSVNSAFTWSLLLCNAYQFCSSNVRVLQHHSVHAFDMSIIIIFEYLGLCFKLNQLSSNNSSHTSCICKGLHAGKWPDLLTSKPDAVSTLRYHWTDYTGITLADAIAQWSSSGNPELKICQLLRGKQCLNSLGSVRSCCNSKCVIWSKYFCILVHATGPGWSWWHHQMEPFSALLALCCREFTGPGKFPAQRASDAELWCFLWSAPE